MKTTEISEESLPSVRQGKDSEGVPSEFPSGALQLSRKLLQLKKYWNFPHVVRYNVIEYCDCDKQVRNMSVIQAGE